MPRDQSSDRSDLRVRGELVTQLRFDFAFTIVTEHSTVRVEQSFRLTPANGKAYAIDPEKPTRADDLLTLHETALDADCRDDGSLSLRFSNGCLIDVAPNDRFEAWTLTRDDGEMAVATHGGGIITFELRAD